MPEDLDHPVSHALAMATAEALATADPPVPLTGPSIDRAMAELEHVLPANVRVAFMRPRPGDWEARPYDPEAKQGDNTFDVVGRGRTLGAAIRALVAELRDSVRHAARAAA